MLSAALSIRTGAQLRHSGFGPMTDARAAAESPPDGSQFGRGLPVLGRSVYALKALEPRPSTAVTHLVTLAAGDPALALLLFARVNPDLERSGRAPAEQLQHAALIVGVPAFIETFARAAAIAEDDPDPRVRALLRIFARGQHAAWQARAWAEYLPEVRAASAEAAVLALHGLEAARALERIGGEAAQGVSPDALAAALPPLARPPDDEDAPGARCVALAGALAADVEDQWDNEALAPRYEALAELIRREPHEAERLVKCTAAAAARRGMHFNVRPAAVNLVSPGPWPPDDAAPGDAPPATEDMDDAGEAGEHGAGTPPEPPAVAADVEAVVEALRTAVRAGRSSTTLLTIALAGLSEECGYRLATFWLLDRRAGTFALKIHRGTPLPAGYEGKTTSTADSPLFARLVERSRTLSLHPARDERVLRRLEPAVRRLAGRHGCALHSVVVDGRPLGVILACRPTDPDGPAHFKRVAGALDAALRARSKRAVAAG